MAVLHVALEITPRLAFRMHAEDEDFGAGLAGACAVKRLEGNVTNRAD